MPEEPTRQQRHRQRQAAAGLVALTVWVSPETKARYTALALTERRTVSELARAALDAWDPDVPETDAETSPRRILVEEELQRLTPALLQHVLRHVTAQLPELIRAELAQVLGGASVVTETVTETLLPTPAPDPVQVFTHLAREHPGASLGTLARLAHSEGRYSARGKDGTPKPANRGTVARWLAQARRAVP
jgi:hypothetical protein